MASIALEGVRKVYGAGHVAVRDVSLDIADGERVALVGPSGSGKSTLLRIIAGLESVDAGRVRLGDRDVTELPPEARDLAMVFQSYALYPHLSVRENLAFGLRMRRRPREAIDAAVRDTAATLGLDAMLDRRPAQLSGGQRQRVALGRAIVRQPQAFLFDEPLSNLDPALRAGTRAELIALHGRLGATMVYVTHDQEEAMTLGQRIAVLRDGVLQQAAPPAVLYDEPVNVFVAQFIGSPAMNLFTGAAAAALAPADLRDRIGREGLTLGVRPHDLAIVPAGEGAVAGAVALVEPLGHAAIVRVELPAHGPAVVVAADRPWPRAGEALGLRPASGRWHLFDREGLRA